MFTGRQITDALIRMGVTHVVFLPDSTLGQWEADMVASGEFEIVRVCREGEAWPIAAGLYLGGAKPLIMIQCTGLFESGDAVRNIIHDYQLPLFAVIGYRSFLSQETLPGDTCLVFTEPILETWHLDYRLIDEPSKFDLIEQHYHDCQAQGKPGVALIAEGKA